MTHPETHIKTRATRKKEDIEADIEAIDAILERKIAIFRQYSPQDATPNSPQYTSSATPIEAIDICQKKIDVLNSEIQKHTPSGFTALWEQFFNHFFKLFYQEELPELSARRERITRFNEGIQETKAFQTAQAILLVTENREKETQKLEQAETDLAHIPGKIDALKAKLQPFIEKTFYRKLKTQAASAIETFGKFSKPGNKLLKISLTLTAYSLLDFLNNPTEKNRQRFLKTEQQHHVDWQKAKNAAAFMPLLVEANTIYELDKALPEQQQTLTDTPKRT